MPHKGKFLVAIGAVTLVLGGLAMRAAMTSTSGPVYTTNESGTETNQNQYPTASSVYLNGGPHNAKCTGSGLADGAYYFQVTDTSGKNLLSSDGLSQRTFTVLGGVIKAYAGTHATGSGACASKTVSVAPFATSSNGEYKVWVTPVAKYVAGNGTFGFQQSDSNTDNFKIAGGGSGGGGPTGGTVAGKVYNDLNANGTNDGESGQGGVMLNLKTAGSTTVVASTTSGIDGSYTLSAVPAGNYDLCEVVPAGASPTEPVGGGGCAHITVTDGGTVTQNFGNTVEGPR